MIRDKLTALRNRRSRKLSGNCPGRRTLSAAAILWAVILCAPAPPAYGQESPPPIIRVEEDWYLKVRTPMSQYQGPQITAVMSPQENLSGHYSVFTVNYSDLPTFTMGGLQLQVWDHNTDLATMNDSNQNTMWTTDEIIRFTRKMTLTSDGNLKFEIINGRSTTWGSFGSVGELILSVPTTLTDLSDYSPETTVALSGISRSAHNMDVVMISAVRYFSADGLLVLNDRDDRYVFTHTDYTKFLTYEEYLATPYLLDPNSGP